METKKITTLQDAASECCQASNAQQRRQHCLCRLLKDTLGCYMLHIELDTHAMPYAHARGRLLKTSASLP